TIARSWARHTPESFRFSAKVPRAITHEALLKDAAPGLTAFARALEPLGERMGPVLVQMPAEFTRDDDTVRVLEGLPAAKSDGLPTARAFRPPAGHGPGPGALLRGPPVAIGWPEWRELPRVTEITADFLSPRCLGDRREIERYDRVQIDREDSFRAW